MSEQLPHSLNAPAYNGLPRDLIFASVQTGFRLTHIPALLYKMLHCTHPMDL